MRPKILLLAIAAAAVLAGWLLERLESRRLQAELDLLQPSRRELAQLQGEHERLLAAQPTAARLAALQATDAERERLLRVIDARKAAPTTAPFSLGEWMPSATWENRGRATPRAALETVLWAAAGGDVATLAAALELDDATRAKADELLARLPPDARGDYRTPEALVAGVTTRNIPTSSAQVAWLHETDADHATVGVLFPNLDPSGPAADEVPVDGAGDRPPPMLKAKPIVRLVTLTLHRLGSDWRLVVAAPAIDRMARELTDGK
ncbi:MAG TPA: hypothetical protein VHE13_11610 [Opitutus sp.]|nr:hypothetical protein [Opitutus sp.]